MNKYYDTLSKDDRDFMVDMLHDEALASIVRKSTVDRDFDLIRKMLEKNRFDIDVDDIKFLKTHSFPMLSDRVPVMIDALASFAQLRLFQIDYQSTGISGLPISQKPIWSYRMTMDDEGQKLFSDISEYTIKDLRALYKNGKISDVCAHHTESLITAVALVSNHLDFVQKMLDRPMPDGDEMHRVFKLAMSHSKKFLNKTDNTVYDLTPVGLALCSNAEASIQLLLEQEPGLLTKSVGVIVKNNGSHQIQPYDVFEITDLMPTEKTIEMLYEAYSACLDHKFYKWEAETLIPFSLNGKWPHLSQFAIDKGIYARHADISLAKSLDEVNCKVVDHVLTKVHGDAFSYGYCNENSKEISLEHPLNIALKAVSVYSPMKDQMDKNVARVLKEMEERGLRDQAIECSLPFKKPVELVTQLIENKCQQSLQQLIFMGLDVDQKIGSHSLSEYARMINSEDAADLLSTAKNYKSAMVMLDEIMNSDFSLHPH